MWENKTTTRRKTRLVVLQVLCEVDAVGHSPQSVLDARVEAELLSSSAEIFARALVTGVLEHLEETDSIISEFAPNWPVDKLAIVDRNILRLAIHEIMIEGETPPKVAVNEAVELAKVFGADNSHKFVNGVLGSVMETVGK